MNNNSNNINNSSNINNTNGINRLIEVKLFLTDEIKSLEYGNANIDYFNSLPINNREIRNFMNKYNELNIGNHEMYMEKKELLSEVRDYLYAHCSHEWIEDDIDIGVEDSLHVEYCKLCQVRK